MPKILPPGFALLLLLVFCAGATRARAAEKVFFAFDDQSIPWQHNLKVTLVPAQKYAGNPVLRKGPPGSPDHGHAVLYGTVIKQGDKFRMWYLGMFETATKDGQAPGWWRPMCYAESLDGIHWTKPELGLVDFNGNKRNNICRIEGDPFSLTRVDDFLSVLFDPQDPDPARRYKVAYIAHMPYAEIHGGMSGIGKKEERVCSTVCATSPDGLDWKVVGDRPANAGNERFEVSSLYRFGKFYYVTGQLLAPWAWRADGSDIGRAMLAYRSPDFVTWSQEKTLAFARPGELTNPPVPGQHNHMGAGLWNRGNVLVGLYGMWQDGPPPAPDATEKLRGTHINLGLILSNDGMHFREPVPNFQVLSRGPKGAWDHVALLQANAFVNQGDQTMIWYSHWDTGGSLDGMEIGLATMRRDGFGYLSRKQTDQPGDFVTCPIAASFNDRTLRVNAEGLSPQSPLTVELLDDADRPIPGFSGAGAAKLTVSGTELKVIWPESESNRLPEHQAFAVRVSFPDQGDERVYALTLR